MAAGYFEHTLA